MGKGLLAELEIQWSNFSLSLHINYWEVPYQCLQCHEMRHILASCSMGTLVVWRPRIKDFLVSSVGKNRSGPPSNLISLSHK